MHLEETGLSLGLVFPPLFRTCFPGAQETGISFGYFHRKPGRAVLENELIGLEKPVPCGLGAYFQIEGDENMARSRDECGLNTRRLEQGRVEDRNIVTVAGKKLEGLLRELEVVDCKLVFGKFNIRRCRIDNVGYAVQVQCLVECDCDLHVLVQ